MIIDQGERFSVYTQGTAEAIATQAAPGASRYIYVTDVAASSDRAGTQVFIDNGTTTMFNLSLGSASNIPFSHNFHSPLRGNANTAVRVRVGSATSLSWAFIAGYIV